MSQGIALATYADLLAFPEGERVEVLAGSVVASPAPLPAHSRPQCGLARFVGGPFDGDDGAGGPGGWWIFVEVDVRLAAHDIVRPDLSGWRRTRLPRPNVRPIDVEPDWVCEIVSPTSAARDRVQKWRLYARHGVRHYWLVDPDARTLEAFELRDGAWVDVGHHDDGEGPVRVPPFEAVEIPIARLFLPRSALPEDAER
ncbi:MAG: Uma2 family endonuclease [Polyangiaceae bacterium]|nr:Uma2 family endonuclease [Polyangiaceae bacterium]